jgi:GTP-binding protein
MGLPLVAIVGAPNVGKSTLFNRLVGRRRSIVTDEPGVTRDRIEAEVRDAPRPFVVVDTGGLTLSSDLPLVREVERQVEAALAEASAVLFVVDARTGATGLDHDLAALLRRRGCRPLLVANKVDSPGSPTHLHELSVLGLGEPLPISAEHGLGIDRLLDAVDERLPPGTATADPAPRVCVAVVGRPNVGKSSLVNRLLGEERVVVSSEPGTTRDAVDTLLDVGERRYRLVDTAGLRRPGRIREVVERHSAGRARENIERCDVAVLVLDGTSDITAQDAHVAGYVVQGLKPLVVVVTKWDLVRERESEVKRWSEALRTRLRFVPLGEPVFTSAVTGQRVLRVLDRVDAVHAAAGIRVPTQALNRWLQEHPTATGRADRGPGFRLFYATQTGVHPPRFVLFCNDPERVHFSIRRYLENDLRERFGFGPAPIRLVFRGRREAARS